MSRQRNKMYDYEVTPPPDAWSKIADALDEASLENKFPATLYNMEIRPPAAAWEAISDSLSSEKDEKVIPLRRKAPMFFRYAAAVVVIGVIAFGVLKLTGTNNTDHIGTAHEDPSKDTNTSKIDTMTESGETEAPQLPIRDETESSNIVASLDHPVKNAVRALSVDIAPNKVTSSNEDSVSAVAGRYIMLMTPNGNIIRMSKKWSDLVCCVSGEEQDEDCKLQIKKWQKKIATSPINPSPGNFMDILELVNSLDEGVEL